MVLENYVPPVLSAAERLEAEKEISAKVEQIQKLVKETTELAEKTGLTFRVAVGSGGFGLREIISDEYGGKVEYFRYGRFEDGLYPIGEWYSSSMDC